MNNEPVYVTMPSLAPLEEYTELLKGVWQRGILTHNGPLVQQFEKDFNTHFKVKQSVAVSNGTIALQMAIKALALKGEIITSPFTWIATVSAIQWEGCKPVFVDVDPTTLNIDPALIEAAITKDTVAIMPVHVFGNLCDVAAIDAIAKKHNLKVIYDAAHAIGSEYNGRSALECGDISATSYHATKILNTAEGGSCITTDNELHEKLKRIRFFGHNDKKDIVEEGFNGKLTEVNAALGLANLKYMDAVLADRKTKYNYYKDALKEIPEVSFQKIGTDCNYSYFPIIFKSEEMLFQVESELNKANVFPRRYFYPSVNTYTNILEYQPCPKSEDVSRRILCLPLYYTLPMHIIDTITGIIKSKHLVGSLVS
jgi:dTDP-4-amino-4,6-dideoxygalactose transaminase